MPNIRESIEEKRGCGYRKGGGKYFRCDGIGRACEKLPVPLTVCPYCSCGIKPARGFTWISGLMMGSECPGEDMPSCLTCPFRQIPDRLGLMWVGGSYYPTPESFVEEARKMGVSKRFSQLPTDFVLGKTWIAIAHKEVDINGKKVPAIFHAFKPTRIEYVVRGDETDEELERYEKRGFELVRVIPMEEEKAKQDAERERIFYEGFEEIKTTGGTNEDSNR